MDIQKDDSGCIVWNESILQKFHQVLYMILCEFDQVCTKNNIRYFLGGGTLLGAVRHQGFIPWDDDVDVFMLREEYEKLEAIADQLPETLFLQTRRTDPGYHGVMPKIRLNGTTCATKFSAGFPMHQGIFIDIFIHDKTANTKRGQAAHIFLTLLGRSMVFHKWEGTPMHNYGKHKLLCGMLTILIRLIPFAVLERFRDGMISFFTRWRSNNLYYYDGMGEHLRHGSFPCLWLESRTYARFREKDFPVPEQYHEYLVYSYGNNYMVPVPPAEQMPAHDITALEFGRYE